MCSPLRRFRIDNDDFTISKQASNSTDANNSNGNGLMSWPLELRCDRDGFPLWEIIKHQPV